MSAPRTYWIGQQFVAEWTLRDINGAPVADATVNGQVVRPDATTAAMTITNAGSGIYRAVHVATMTGTHAYSLTATGSLADAAQGVFVVARNQVAAPPITLDPTTQVGQLRLLITDVDEASPLFTDAQLSAFLAMEGSVKLAAATALETIARSEVLISKKIRTSDGLSTDGPAVAKELRESAKELREQAAAESDAADGFGMEVVDFDPLAAYREW
ncbi:hypothetical protein ACGFIY_21345 [Micromonospora chersina]|uniref:hypothetical protein n=1 Tax=Micromonospora chersina TaxID=47854 RepID=UPI00371686E9